MLKVVSPLGVYIQSSFDYETSKIKLQLIKASKQYLSD